MRRHERPAARNGTRFQRHRDRPLRRDGREARFPVRRATRERWGGLSVALRARVDLGASYALGGIAGF
jgi:hypothetical protein